jgi:homoserine O-acetyltransferase
MALAALRAGREVSYVDVDAAQGHDAFLLPVPRYLEVLGTYLRGLELRP